MAQGDGRGPSLSKLKGIFPVSNSPSRTSDISAFSQVKRKLDRGVQSAVIHVIGDSTGAGKGPAPTLPLRWVWDWTLLLAALYPNYTVNYRGWDEVANVYLTTVVVQTGTAGGAAPVLDIYNMSASGKDPAYSRQYMFIGMPNGVVPDLVVINHGHNITQAADALTQGQYYQIARNFAKWRIAQLGTAQTSGPPFVCVTQNPRTDGNAAVHANRIECLRELCATEKWNLVDTYLAFLAQPNWQSLILDGIHPTDAGSALWASWVHNAFLDASNTWATPTALEGDSDSRIVISPLEMVPSLILLGAPAAGVQNNFMPTMAYSKQVGTYGASCVVHVPDGWRSVDIWIYWTTTDGAAGNVVWQIDPATYPRVGVESASGTNGTAITIGSAGGTSTGAAPGAAYASSHTLWASNLTFTGGRDILLRVSRKGDSVSDTLVGTAHLFALVIDRSS